MESPKNYNLNTNEGFVIILTPKLFTCFIGDFALITKSQSIAYLLNGSEHIYWILDVEGEVHSIWDLRVSGLQECKSYGFFQNRAGGQQFSGGSKKLFFSSNGLLPPLDSDSAKSSLGVVNVPHHNVVGWRLVHNLYGKSPTHYYLGSSR